ncbi:unnamed protein product [Urochloa humidicola]
MVNTRSGSGVDLPEQRRQRNPNLNPQQNQPPPMAGNNMELFFQAQMALLQNLTITVAGLQTNQGANNNQPPRSKLQEFMTHRPPTFSHSADPLEADDWLKTVEKMLNIAQCTDREKVLYASGRFEGTARDWWDAYTAAHANADTITWQEFRNSFRNHHIPAGLMKLKKKEFLALKQGGMSVSEYRDRFIQLSRYAPEDVADDEKKQDLFLEGLIGPLNYQLTPTTFPNFQSLVDKAIAMEHKRNALGDQKRKFSGFAPSSNTRPRFIQSPQGTPFRSVGSSGNLEQRQGQLSPLRPQRLNFDDTPSQSPVRPVAPSGSNPTRGCFNCGDPDHFANNCPKRNEQTQQVQNSSADTQNTPQQHNRNGNRMPQSNRGPQNYLRGTVNNIGVQVARDAQNVALGMSHVNSVPNLSNIFRISDQDSL